MDSKKRTQAIHPRYSFRFPSKSSANAGCVDVQVIVNGTIVTDFFFIRGTIAFNTTALNPDVVSDSFPLVCKTPRRLIVWFNRLYVPRISARVPGVLKETPDNSAIPSFTDT